MGQSALGVAILSKNSTQEISTPPPFQVQRDICLQNQTYRIQVYMWRKLTEADGDGGRKIITPEGAREMVKTSKRRGAKIDANGGKW